MAIGGALSGLQCIKAGRGRGECGGVKGERRAWSPVGRPGGGSQPDVLNCHALASAAGLYTQQSISPGLPEPLAAPDAPQLGRTLSSLRLLPPSLPTVRETEVLTREAREEAVAPLGPDS